MDQRINAPLPVLPAAQARRVTILVNIDGVLRTDIGVPLADGEQLVRSLIAGNRVVLVSPKDTSQLKVEQFLALGGIKGYAHIYYGEDVLGALRQERCMGTVSMVFLADTDIAQKVFRQGITVCLVAGATFVRPDWKPTRKTWGEITSEAYLSGFRNTEQQDTAD